MSAARLEQIIEPSALEQPALDAGRRVLWAEAEALHRLAAELDGAFTAAVERIALVGGRVVVTGMGKSGHVARKIASTFASTGTPALYVHPAEASHGDLGMIARSDLVLALSNSGETPELADLVGYSRRFGIPLIAMVGRRQSTLSSAADLVLALPPLHEACPLGLAPTTSTTAMLALGDALAVALLERRGFDVSDFGLLHPGGKLGRRLIKVADLMHTGAALPVVASDAPMTEALLEMTAKRLGCVGVLGAGGRLAGIITDGDLRRHMSDDLLERRAYEVMTRSPRTIAAQALAAEALGLMNGATITVLFVTRADGTPEGVLHLHDCLRAGVA